VGTLPGIVTADTGTLPALTATTPSVYSSDNVTVLTAAAATERGALTTTVTELGDATGAIVEVGAATNTLPSAVYELAITVSDEAA